MFATVNRDEDSEPLDYPEPVPRPGDQPDTPGNRTGAPTSEELMRFFA